MIAALVMRTWLAMGLIVPVTISGSSMAPTFQGPHRVFRCPNCQGEFSLGLDELQFGLEAACPVCGTLGTYLSVGGDRSGDRLIIDRTAFQWRSPRRWEVVVFRNPEAADQLCVKRVLGLPGETVSFAHGELYINGQLVPKPFQADYEVRYGDRPEHNSESAQTGGHPTAFWRLGPDEFFVGGDNAALSDDSRNWLAGPGLDAKLLIGKPLGVR